MTLFNAGAMRPANDAARLSAANDLVRRTLAQHGLMAPDGQGATAQPAAMPSLQAALDKYLRLAGAAADLPVPMPDGASFEADTFACTAGERRYRTYVPASVSGSGRATGVVVMLHGCTQTPEDFAAGTGMNALADTHGFVVVYPAQSRGDNAQSCWNWFSCRDQRRGRGEPAILAALAQHVCADYGVARDRTFVAGLSAGAAMAVILGETYPDVFAAVGAHSGLPAGSAKDVASAFAAMAGNAVTAAAPAKATQRVRTIVFHGTQDSTVHPSNSDAIVRRARDAHAPTSVQTTTQGDAGGRGFTRVVSSDLDGAMLVEHWTVQGQGHAWSGGQPAGSYTDRSGPDASAEMIRFFLDADGRRAWHGKDDPHLRRGR